MQAKRETAIVEDSRFLDHRGPTGHPERPDRLKAVRAAVGCEGFNVLQNNGSVAHQVIPHVHFHIIPRNRGDEFHFNWPAGTYPAGRIEELAERIRAALGE